MILGTAEAEARAGSAPTMPDLATDALTLEGVEILQVLYEIGTGGVAELLPPALHPTVPGVVTWLVYVCPASPWGAFRLAQTRIQCRSGTRPRGWLVSGVVDNEEAKAALTERWGFSLQSGAIDFRRGYDGVDVTVESAAGDPILEIGLREPTLLPPGVVQFVSSIHPAHTPNGYRLVQVDPAHAVDRAERGEPLINQFDATAWGDARIEPAYPISATICLADVTLPRLRFLCRPGELAFTGTEVLPAAS